MNYGQFLRVSKNPVFALILLLDEGTFQLENLPKSCLSPQNRFFVQSQVQNQFSFLQV